MARHARPGAGPERPRRTVGSRPRSPRDPRRPWRRSRPRTRGELLLLVDRVALRGAIVLVATVLSVAQSVDIAPMSAEVLASGVVAEMSTAQRAGQLVMTSVRGTRLAPSEGRMLRRANVGGVILFRGNYRGRRQVTRLTTQLQRNLRQPGVGLLVSVDQEGGVVKRFPDLPPNRSAPELGRMPVDASRRAGSSTGIALRRIGVNVDLAPVADLDQPPRRELRQRSFGSGRRKVARRVAAFASGLESQRVAATAKHFPGLGAATGNSDTAVTRVVRSRTQLRTVELVPFRAAIAADVDLVMVSHALYSAYGARRPASVSPAIVTRLLRGELGFAGVAISDSLHAQGFRAAHRRPVGASCVDMVRAGIDIVLLTGSARDALACSRAIAAAARAGRISQARLTQAARRVVALKQTLGTCPTCDAAATDNPSADATPAAPS